MRGDVGAAKPGEGRRALEDSAPSFDLRTLYYGRGHSGYGFVVHEAYHGIQGEASGTYESGNSRWHAESTASFGCDYAFPATSTYAVNYVVAPGVPLNMFFDREVQGVSDHFLEMGHDWGVRGGHIYAAFLFWSFLANHAQMPGVAGRMETARPLLMGMFGTGELFAMRAFMQAEGKDLGDVFANFVAHLRTADLPPFGDSYGDLLEESFDGYNGPRVADAANACPSSCDTCDWWDCADYENWHVADDPAKDCAWVAERPDARCSVEGIGIFGTKTLDETRNTVVVTGDTGGMVPGPAAERPGPFAWNDVAVKLADPLAYATIAIAWDDLAVDAASELEKYGSAPNPHDLNALHADCVDDARFFSARVVRVNPDGTRSYWKMDGKNPDPITIEITGPDAEIHVLLAPTPPADYVNDFQRVEGTFGCGLCWKNPVPCYGYEYAITTTDFGDPTPEAPQKHGVVEFVDATDAPWFDPVCTCTAVETRVLFENGGGDIYASTDSCIDPVFGAIDSPPPPTPAPTLTRSPTPSSTEDQGDGDEGGGDIPDGRDDPSPTAAPTCVDS